MSVVSASHHSFPLLRGMAVSSAHDFQMPTLLPTCEFVMGMPPCSNHDAVCDSERRGQIRSVVHKVLVVTFQRSCERHVLCACVIGGSCGQGTGHMSWGHCPCLSEAGTYRRCVGRQVGWQFCLNAISKNTSTRQQEKADSAGATVAHTKYMSYSQFAIEENGASNPPPSAASIAFHSLPLHSENNTSLPDFLPVDKKSEKCQYEITAASASASVFGRISVLRIVSSSRK